jgi:DNA-binding transcriptional regulator GbsR (MarR family)
VTGTSDDATADGLDWQQSFIEDLGVLGREGLPRSATRILGWLVVCTPAHQTGPELQQGLHLSAGSVSTATDLLLQLGLIERTTFPADRRLHYRLRPDAWEVVLGQRLQVFRQLRRVAETATASGGGDNDRLRSMRDYCARCEREVDRLRSELGGPA